MADCVLVNTTSWKYIDYLKRAGCEVKVCDCTNCGKYPVMGVFVKYGNYTKYNLGAAPNYNIAIGNSANYFNSTGFRNVAIGYTAGYGVTGNSHADDVFIGYQAGFGITTGGTNVCIGNYSGYSLTSGDGNVFIGYDAAKTQETTGNNKLYIANTDTATPLIYGEFDNALLKFYGKTGSPNAGITLGVGVTTFAVTRNVHTITGDALGNTIATITGGVDGQLLTLIFVDALVTITDDGTSTADTFNLSAAFTSTANDTMQLVYDGTSWREVSRSVN